MAIRSTGGTGVLVALVVFVLTTVFLLVMTIVFYAGRDEATVKMNEAEARLAEFITASQRGDDAARAVQAAATNDRESVYGFLMKRQADVAEFVAGDRAADLGTMRSSLGVPENSNLKDFLSDLRRREKSKSDEAAGLATQLTETKKQRESLETDLATAKANAKKEAEAIRAEIAQYRTAADDLRDEVTEARAAIERTKDDREARHQSQVAQMQEEVDSLRAEESVLQSRIAALQAKVDVMNVKPKDPAELVDGRIVAIDPGANQVFIDLGRSERIVPGMTFEVYDDANAIGATDGKGGANRGKASIQVVRVADGTSTAKIIRSTTARPVVKDDVIANAVFDTDYRYKFLVHGRFDVDGDGRPSESEADYLKSRVVEWGGEVIEGDALTGDVDFLVIGVVPPMPAPLPPDASEAQTLAALELRKAREDYDRLFQQAVNAKIPVLNWNRFQVLTGGGSR
jgi:hypothetical protein